MRSCALLFFLLVASGCSSISVTERALIQPQRAESPPSSGLDSITAGFPGVAYEEQRIKAPDGTMLYGALLRQPGADLTVLYFGGNGYTIDRFGAGTARALLPLGVNVLLVDHRGYGWSTGEPSTALLLTDALVVFDHAAAIPEAGAVVVHGQSLGSFLAGHVGAHRATGGIVLESSSTTPQEWAESRVPLLYRPFVRIRVDEPLRAVDNRAAVQRITEPLLLLAGAEDSATPHRLARRLYEASPLPESRKALVVMKGAGHNDVMEQDSFADVYQAFLDRVRGSR